jgi:hypothetical protein
MVNLFSMLEHYPRGLLLLGLTQNPEEIGIARSFREAPQSAHVS